jgi:hypothetical protein
MMRVNERGTEVKCKCIGRINNEEEDGQASTMPDSRLHVNGTGLVNVSLIKFGKDILSSECLGSAHSRDDLLGQCTSVGNML